MFGFTTIDYGPVRLGEIAHGQFKRHESDSINEWGTVRNGKEQP